MTFKPKMTFRPIRWSPSWWSASWGPSKKQRTDKSWRISLLFLVDGFVFVQSSLVTNSATFLPIPYSKVSLEMFERSSLWTTPCTLFSRLGTAKFDHFTVIMVLIPNFIPKKSSPSSKSLPLRVFGDLECLALNGIGNYEFSMDLTKWNLLLFIYNLIVLGRNVSNHNFKTPKHRFHSIVIQFE